MDFDNFEESSAKKRGAKEESGNEKTQRIGIGEIV